MTELLNDDSGFVCHTFGINLPSFFVPADTYDIEITQIPGYEEDEFILTITQKLKMDLSKI